MFDVLMSLEQFAEKRISGVAFTKSSSLSAFHTAWRRWTVCVLFMTAEDPGLIPVLISPRSSVGVLETAEQLCCDCVCDWGHSSKRECFLQWAFIVSGPGLLQCSYWGSQPQRVERELSAEMECRATKLTMWNSWPGCVVVCFVLSIFYEAVVLFLPCACLT